MNSLFKKAKFLKSKVAKTLFVLAGVVILFSWFPSCGSRNLRTITVVESHPTRDGHMTAPIEYSDYIKDVSFKIEDTKDPTEATVGLMYMKDGGESGDILELELMGAFGTDGDPLIAQVKNEEHSDSVRGAVSCLVQDCSDIVTIEITYKDKNDQEQTVQGRSTRGSNVVFNEPENPANNNDGTRPGNIIIGPVIPARVASDAFVSYWKSYLNTLESTGKNISSELPSDAIETNYSGTDGDFITLSSDAPTDTFARPINMRLSQEIIVNEQDLTIPGILLNGEKLVDSEEHCIIWSKNPEDSLSTINEEHRYASSLLNATLLFVGQKLKRGGACSINIVLGQASNQKGGELTLLGGNGHHETHQNGLDVDIAYITPQSRQGLFASTVDDEGTFTLGGSYLKWQRSLMKYFYDTGMVNRFVTSPEIKAQLVKLSKDEGNLSIYQDTLSKIYPHPAPKYKDRMHLEIICAAGGTVPNKGVTENRGCRDTSASSRTWLVDWCNDNVCWGEEQNNPSTTLTPADNEQEDPGVTPTPVDDAQEEENTDTNPTSESRIDDI